MIITINNLHCTYAHDRTFVVVPLFMTMFVTSHSFFLSFHSLYPHLFSRAYINFKNPEDILLFRDRFDGYVFIDNKGISWFCLNSVWLCSQYGGNVSAIFSAILNANKSMFVLQLLAEYYGQRGGFRAFVAIVTIWSPVCLMMSCLLFQYLLRPGVSCSGRVRPLPENFQEEA